jgi:cyanate lyase
MNETASFQQLDERLGRIEAEVTLLRKELAKFCRGKQIGPAVSLGAVPRRSVHTDKRAIGRSFRDLRGKLGLRAVPMGAELLQQQMAQAGLAANELSQSLVQAREE